MPILINALKYAEAELDVPTLHILNWSLELCLLVSNLVFDFRLANIYG